MPAQTLSQQINRLFAKEDWKAARKIIERELKRTSPAQDNHWLLSRLGTTYYEEKDYETALECILKAHDVDPKCLLVRWNLANVLYALELTKDSIIEFTKIIHDVGTKTIADLEPDFHGEGPEWINSLVADCIFRLATCYQKLERPDMAVELFGTYIECRKLGFGSIYGVGDALDRLLKLKKPNPQEQMKQIKKTDKKLQEYQPV